MSSVWGECGTLMHRGFANQERTSVDAFNCHFLFFPAGFFFPLKKERSRRTVVSAITQMGLNYNSSIEITINNNIADFVLIY